MTIEEIHQIIDADTTIDRMNLVEELSRCPKLFSKYLAMYHQESLKLRRVKRKYDELYKKRREFYLGTAPEDDYREEANERKILRQDVETILNADNKLQDQKDKLSHQTCIADMLERTVDYLKWRSKTIDSMIVLIKFESGS